MEVEGRGVVGARRYTGGKMNQEGREQGGVGKMSRLRNEMRLTGEDTDTCAAADTGRWLPFLSPPNPSISAAL